MDDERRMMAAAGGSNLYVGAGTYRTSDGTLKNSTKSIFIREDCSAMITSIKVNNVALIATTPGYWHFVGGDLKQGDFYTFSKQITEIVISGGSFIGYQS